MKSLVVALSVFLAGQAAAANTPLSVDRFVTDADGGSYVVMTSEWTDFNGGTMQVEQRLSLDGFGRLIYRYDEQTEATKLYHQAFCETMNMLPSQGEGIMGGPSTGWACTTDVFDDDTAGHAPSNSIDWVTATAPNGRVPVGVSYRSFGQMRMESSIGGARRATIGVDNGRCSFTDVKNYAGSFRESTSLSITCIVHESRFVNTSMNVCIPKQCVSDAGTQFAQ